MEQKSAYSGELEEIFSNRLKTVMNGTKQETVERDTGIARQNISKYISGKALPNTKNLFILAQYFGVSCDYLLGFVDMPRNELTHFRLKINFSQQCTKTLELISKDAVLTKIFERLITCKGFIVLLRYMETYLTFSAKLKKGTTDKIKESHKRASIIDVTTNKHISVEAYPKDGVKVSETYKGLIQIKLQEIVSRIAKENSAEYSDKITRIAQNELCDLDVDVRANKKINIKRLESIFDF